MKVVTAWSLVTLLPLLSAAVAAALSDAEIDAKARAIDSRVLKIDTHTDVLLPTGPQPDYTPGHSSRTDLDNLTRGGIGAVAFAIAVGPGPRTPEGVTTARAEADAKLAWIQSFVKDHPDRVSLALGAIDIERIHAAGKIAIIESFLNARSIGDDVGAIDVFYRNGVRLFGLTHAGNNDFADSSRPIGQPAVEHHGLSPLGRQAIARLNALGVIIDVSQLTPEGLLQTIELSRAPVIASHSDVRALVDTPRNLSDRELDAIERNGGLVSVTAFNAYLRPLPTDYDARAATLRERYGLPPATRRGPMGAEEGFDTLPADKAAAFMGEFRELAPKATLSDYVDHIDYLVKRIGVDYSPSPGVIYPTLTLLEELGYASVTQEDGGKKQYGLTPEGTAFLETQRELLERILGRLDSTGSAAEARRAPELLRAMQNFRTALHFRFSRGPLALEAVRKIADAIDRAAVEIERS